MDSIIFNIYFILVFGSIWVFTYDTRQWTLLSFTNENQAFQIAGCIAHCKQNPHCQEECRNVIGLSLASTGQETDNNTLLFEDKNGTESSSEPANFNASLHCKDIDVIKIKHNPGLWMIEQRSSLRNDTVVWGERDETGRDVVDEKIMKYIRVINAESVTSATISVFANLSAGTFYRYKAHRVRINDLGGIVLSEAEISPWFKTFELGHRSEEVKSLHLAGTRLDEVNRWRVRADINIEPGSDRSCNYEVISFNEEQGLTIGNVDSSSQDFRFSLRDLDYMRNVSVFVSSRNRGTLGSSGNVSLVFTTPSCLELHRDVGFCAPEQVRGLRVDELSHRENDSNYEILVEWDRPVFPPDNYTLQVQSGLEYWDGSGEPSSLSSPLRSILLPGNTTEALLKLKVNNVDGPEVTSDNERRPRTIVLISIIAESPGGKSLESWINVTLADILETILEGSLVAGPVAVTERDETRGRLLDGLINAVPAAVLTIFGILVLLGIVYYTRRGTGKYRRQRPRRWTVVNGQSGPTKYKVDKSYRYCQNLADAGGKKTRRDSTFYVMEKIAKFATEFEKMDPPLLPATTPIKDKFEIRSSQLTIKGILGSGASGIVRLGTLHRDSSNNRHSSMDVAIKMLKESPNTEDLKNFQQEISIMKSAGQHPNIVSIIGCCTLQVTRPMLVVEYCSRGDLQTYLRAIWQETMSTNTLEHQIRRIIGFQNEKSSNAIPSGTIEKINNVEDTTYRRPARQIAITNQLYDIQEAASAISDQVTVADLLNYARQVASGMEFLASNRIIHRDLAARNVLVCADKTVKISDFGLSRDIYQENVYKKQGNGRLPLKWMAIEALTHQIYTTQSDVWSFGILLWEIVTLGCNPYPDTPTNMVLQYLKSGCRMEKPDNCGNELYNIMMSCWHTRPRRRPNFTQLKHQLDRLLRTVSDNEYLNLYDIHPREHNSSGSGSNSSITNRQDSSKQLVDKTNDYSNIFST